MTFKKNKIIIITGVTRGIGKAIAQACINNGFCIAGVARSEKEAAEVLRALAGSCQENWLAIGADISLVSEVDVFMKRIIERFGGVDVLINNAGIGVLDYIQNSNVADWNRIIDVNLKGAYLCARAALPYMIKEKNGTIINVASVCGLKGYPQYGAYCASKFGLLGFTEVLAQEVKSSGVKVFALCPHAVYTGFANNANKSIIKQEDMLTVDEVASAIMDFILKDIPSQVREIGIHPVTFILRKLGIKIRKIFVKRIKFLL